jgi:sRNA-binding protein
MVGFQLSQDQLEYNRNQIRMAQEAEKAKVKAAEAAAKAQAKAQSSAPKGFANQPQATAPATIQPNQPAAIVVTPAPGPVDITSPVQ